MQQHIPDPPVSWYGTPDDPDHWVWELAAKVGDGR